MSYKLPKGASQESRFKPSILLDTNIFFDSDLLTYILSSRNYQPVILNTTFHEIDRINKSIHCISLSKSITPSQRSRMKCAQNGIATIRAHSKNITFVKLISPTQMLNVHSIRQMLRDRRSYCAILSSMYQSLAELASQYFPLLPNADRHHSEYMPLHKNAYNVLQILKHYTDKHSVIRSSFDWQMTDLLNSPTRTTVPPSSDNNDTIIHDVAKELNLVLMTRDRELQQRARLSGLCCISHPDDLDLIRHHILSCSRQPIFQQPIKPLKKGRRSRSYAKKHSRIHNNILRADSVAI